MQNEIGRIKQLAIYPVKSAGVIEIPNARLTRAGLVYDGVRDHEYMVVEARLHPKTRVNKMVTQRNYPKMAHIKPKITDGQVILTWDGEDEYILRSDINDGLELTTELHDDRPTGVDQKDSAAEWLSDHLGASVRLVKATGPSYKRFAQQTYVPNNNPLTYQDGYPINWFTEASLRELSEAMGEELPWQIFRPQIIVQGPDAQYEHSVRYGLFNGILFENAKPCGRCVITTRDPDTGEVVRKTLKDLAEYMTWVNPKGEKKIIFAENTLIHAEGNISVGDDVIELAYRDPPIKFERSA